MKTHSNHTLLPLVALLACLLLFAAPAKAQTLQRIPGTKISYSFPSKWKYLKTTTVDDNTEVYLFTYKEKPIHANGDTTLPYLRIYVRKNYSKPLADLVFERYMAQPYQSIEDYLTGTGLPPKGGMGFIGAYTHPKNRKDYQFRMVYFKENNTAVEFRLETTRATFSQMEKEFEQILKSLTF